MLELLKSIVQVWKALFTEWLPTLILADLGSIGTLTSILTLTIAAIALYKRFKN